MALHAACKPVLSVTARRVLLALRFLACLASLRTVWPPTYAFLPKDPFTRGGGPFAHLMRKSGHILTETDILEAAEIGRPAP